MRGFYEAFYTAVEHSEAHHTVATRPISSRRS